MSVQKIRLFLQLTRPVFLLGPVLLYALGVGIARYLGTEVDWELYILGQLWVTLLQLGAQYLNEYFDATRDADNPNRTFFSGGSGVIGPGKLSRNVPLIAALTTLTILASLTVILFQRSPISPVLVMIMGLSFLGAFFYSVPPINLAVTGYGELTTSMLVANLVPAFAFLLQYGDLHRLLAMATFPLTVLHLAMMLAFELADYASDLKNQHMTLMVRIGWQRGMDLHNLLIIVAYLLLALAVGLGRLPLAIAIPALITLPLGILQIWQIRRIASGGKPAWSTLTLNGVALFASMAYMLMFAFWTR